MRISDPSGSFLLTICEIDTFKLRDGSSRGRLRDREILVSCPANMLKKSLGVIASGAKQSPENQGDCFVPTLTPDCH
jgi:hypothetical protein